MLKPLLLAAALATATLPPAQAGEVFAFASAVNGVVTGEISAGGEPAAPGTVVTVTGPEGESLGETAIGADGRFTWQPTAPVAHTFAADLGEGLVARLTVPAEDLAPPADDHALRALIAEAVEAQVRPLRRELAEYKEEAGLMDAVGGIGYIFGIFGVAAWVASRRRQRTSSAA